VESFNKTIKLFIGKHLMLHPELEWTDLVGISLKSYMNTLHQTINMCPQTVKDLHMSPSASKKAKFNNIINLKENTTKQQVRNDRKKAPKKENSISIGTICYFGTINAHKDNQSFEGRWAVKVKIEDIKTVSPGNCFYKHIWLTEHNYPKESGKGEVSLQWKNKTFLQNR